MPAWSCGPPGLHTAEVRGRSHPGPEGQARGNTGPTAEGRSRDPPLLLALASAPNRATDPLWVPGTR